jgi:uncharacterized protein (DUF849 family)
MNGKPSTSASNKVIISCAITGAIHVPSLTPHLPITPSQIAENAIGAAEAGAAIVHLHARDPEDGRPTPDPEVFSRFLPEIRAASDVVINITTGGGHGMSLEERTAAARRFQPELCSLNMGSMNFGLFPMLDRIGDFRHEFECYDVGHLYNLAFLLEKGIVEPPLFVQTVFGILGGIGTHPEDLMHMKRTADRLFGDEYVWSMLAAGRHQTPLVTQGAILGGNVRVGLEDSIYLARGVLAESNAQQVEKISRILGELSLETATPDEARQKLGLKGPDRTAIPA